MAIPFTLSSVSFVQPMAGPFKVGSSFYIVALDSSSSGVVKVLKADSDDPSSGWTEQDSSNHPTTTSKTALHAVVDGTDIHIATVRTSTGVYWRNYHKFSTSSNTWTTTDEAIGSFGGSALSIWIGVRSDGDVLVAYQGPTESIMGTDYTRAYLARRESGSWTTDVRLDNQGKVASNFFVRAAIIADQTNDRFHAAYNVSTTIYLSTYLSGNTFGQQDATVDSSAQSGADTAQVDIVAFTDGANRKVRYAYRDSGTPAKISVAGWNDADAPSISVVATSINDNDTSDSFALAVNGTTQYYLYSVGTAVYYSSTGAGNDTWAADSTELASAGGTVWTCKVYDRSGSKLAYLYTDVSNLKYGEKSLSSDVTVALTGSAVTGAAGSLKANLSKALTGQAATYAQGSVSPGRFAALTGEAATFSAGTLGVSTAVALAGSAATYAAGTVTPSLSVALTGESAAYAHGVLNVAITVPLSGEQSAYATGTLSPALSVALSGEAVTYSTGTVTPETGITVALTGEQAAYSAGTFGVSFEVALSGEQATYAAGTVTPSVGIVVALSGEAATYAAGNVGPETSVALAGESVSATAGFLVPGTSVVLGGQGITVATGTITTSLDLTLAGSVVSFSTGTVVSDLGGGDAHIPIGKFIVNLGTMMGR